MVEQVIRITRSIVFILLLFAGLYIRPANAESMMLISDAETQNYLAQVVKPLFNAAGVRFSPNNIFIINDSSLNAFVSDGNYLFVHTGTIMKADNTNELSGILAHETGHILGGHIVRLKLKMEKMQYVMLGSILAAGAAAVSTGRGDAAMAVILGSQSSSLNSILHYQVQEERSADESAVKLLDKTKQSTNGLLSFMKKIKKQNALSGIEENSYFRTHPLTSERISHFEEVSKNNHYSEKTQYDNNFLLVKAKLTAFLNDKNKVMRLYPPSNNSAPARYARSIVAFKQGKISQALSLIESLISEQPQNPYFY
ncbi:MAG: M48 family metalloprotease, partial [Alphaproteobacteria bacterium]|nr:M48 family metalloprotease [Alphaproteobacteria bacterium]